LLGTGPLSAASAEQGPLRLDYGRFERKGAPTKLRVRVDGGTASQGELRLWLSEQYLDGVELRNISPEPERAQAGPDRTVYVFQVLDPNRPAGVSFDLEPREIGRLSGRLGLVNGPEIEFAQVVYP
jgi:hypothetical protein